MPEKITTEQMGTGVKIFAFIIPMMFTAVGSVISISYSTGQSSQKIDTCIEKIKTLEVKVEDSVRVKEQTAVDIAVMKTEMKQVSATLSKIETLLTPKRDRD